MARSLVIAAVVALSVAGASAEKNHKAMFESFKSTYGKKYETAAEESTRFGHFVENVKTADAMQALNPHANFGITMFSDLSPAEFKVYHNADSYFGKHAAGKGTPFPREKLPKMKAGEAIDWRTKGAVTPVKNQGQCGSCWSFSTTGNIEGQWALAGHTLTSLSEQELVSCDTTDSGCNGGLMDNAFNWIVNDHQGKIVTSASYPYVSGQGQVPSCESVTSKPVGAVISGHHDIPHNEDDMASYCFAHGPVSIGVDATSWQTYQGGIMSNCISKALDHGVLIVGFDDNNSPPYWIIKNSWTATWGEQGYIRVAKGTDQCLLTTAPSSSIVGNAPPTPPTPPGPTPPSPPTPPTQPPTPPSPPTPPTPPTPSGGKYTYYSCSDSGCSNCKEYTFPDGACIDEEGTTQSFKATCYDLGFRVSMTLFSDSAKCAGQGSTQKIDADTCYENQSTGGYLKIKCPF